MRGNNFVGKTGVEWGRLHWDSYDLGICRIFTGFEGLRAVILGGLAVELWRESIMNK